jgi:hypothetical protein
VIPFILVNGNGLEAGVLISGFMVLSGALNLLPAAAKKGIANFPAIRKGALTLEWQTGAANHASPGAACSESFHFCTLLHSMASIFLPI